MSYSRKRNVVVLYLSTSVILAFPTSNDTQDRERRTVFADRWRPHAVTHAAASCQPGNPRRGEASRERVRSAYAASQVVMLREIEIDSASVISGSLQHRVPCVTSTRPEVVRLHFTPRSLAHTNANARSCVDTCTLVRLTSRSMLLFVARSPLCPIHLAPFMQSNAS